MTQPMTQQVTREIVDSLPGVLPLGPESTAACEASRFVDGVEGPCRRRALFMLSLVDTCGHYGTKLVCRQCRDEILTGRVTCAGCARAGHECLLHLTGKV